MDAVENIVTAGNNNICKNINSRPAVRLLRIPGKPSLYRRYFSIEEDSMNQQAHLTFSVFAEAGRRQKTTDVRYRKVERGMTR